MGSYSKRSRLASKSVLDSAIRQTRFAFISSGPRAADVIAVGYLFRTKMPDGTWICFNRELAPLGYSYLLVHCGRDTVASCMFADFERKNHHLERTLEFFRERVGLRMEEPRKFGGYGNYYLPGAAVQRGSLVLGERWISRSPG